MPAQRVRLPDPLAAPVCPDSNTTDLPLRVNPDPPTCSEGDKTSTPPRIVFGAARHQSPWSRPRTRITDIFRRPTSITATGAGLCIGLQIPSHYRLPHIRRLPSRHRRLFHPRQRRHTYTYSRLQRPHTTRHYTIPPAHPKTAIRGREWPIHRAHLIWTHHIPRHKDHTPSIHLPRPRPRGQPVRHRPTTSARLHRHIH